MIFLREVFELWIKFPVQVPCVMTRGCGSAGVQCTPMMERHDVRVVIEGRPSELGRRRVYHRDGCSSIGPRPRRCPRFCAAPISARQHLIHIVATLSHPLCADFTTHSLSSADFLRQILPNTFEKVSKLLSLLFYNLLLNCFKVSTSLNAKRQWMLHPSNPDR